MLIQIPKAYIAALSNASSYFVAVLLAYLYDEGFLFSRESHYLPHFLTHSTSLWKGFIVQYIEDSDTEIGETIVAKSDDERPGFNDGSKVEFRLSF